MAVPAGYDIGLDSTDPADANAVRGFVLANHRQQDITPSSARRSDGDTRFQLIPSESFWSQSDVSGGYGRIYPHDPTAYWAGPADTLDGARLRSAWEWTGDTAMPGGTVTYEALSSQNADTIYVIAKTGGSSTRTLYSYVPSSGGWNLESVATSQQVTSVVQFRGRTWVAYGTAANVEYYSAGSPTTPSPNFKARVMCSYSSMLFYVYYNSTTQTWRINRYDPENTAAVADLGILPVSDSVADYVRSLVVLGPDLFIVCRDALYKFTSANGNFGTLVGPLDTWTPLGKGARDVSGYAAVAYQGALVYSIGGALRRHQPGGGSRTIWPVPPGRNSTTVGGDESGLQMQIGCLVPYGDRLYCVAVPSGLSEAAATTAHSIYLFCWTGQGMHWLGSQSVTTTTAQTMARPLAAIDGYGNLFAGLMVAGTAGSNEKLGYWVAGSSVARKYKATTTFRTSILDFGMLDLDKVISRVGVACTVPDDATHSVAVTVHVLDRADVAPAWTARSLATRTGAYSEVAGAYGLVYFSRSSSPIFLKGQLFYLEITLTGPAASTSSIDVAAISCIPNPVYPVRHGFRVEIPLHTGVRLHDGNLAYADQAAVTAALAYLRGLRASSYPFTLDWIDGASYAVRCNTIQIARDTTRPNESAWRVTLDLQEVSA